MTNPNPCRACRGGLWSAVSLAVVTYLDRVRISPSSAAMQAELGLRKIHLGYAFGSAYPLFEIPKGWMGDRIWPRWVKAQGMLWLSARWCSALRT